MRLTHGDAERLFPAVNLDQKNGTVPVAEIAPTTTFTGPGRFGFMMPGLTPFRPSDASLIALAHAMEDVDTANGVDNPADDNEAMPSGYTYLGQFVDHDITRDKTQGFPPINDPVIIQQARTPSLDLDSVYGLGPVLQPELYDGPPASARMKIGHTSATPPFGDPHVPVSLPFDLPRAGKTALIGDSRNDENLIVAQTHLAFLRFHNKLMDTLPDDGTGRDRFTQVQEEVRRHYQFVVLHDMVGRMAGRDVVDGVLAHGRKFFKFENSGDGRPFMPLEFSVAAYRLGHSMIRQSYDYNRVFRHGGVVPATLSFLFQFTGNDRPNQGSAPIPSDWIIDWRRFFFVGPAGPVKPNLSRKLDTKLANPLKNLPEFADIPGDVPSLAERNLLRGSRVGLPSGQTLAHAMGLPVLSAAQIGAGADGDFIRSHGFDTQTPLWYYILREAIKTQGGLRLGVLGGTLLAETFVGLLQGDPSSVLHAPNWKPKIPVLHGEMAMADILNFLGDLNPVG